MTGAPGTTGTTGTAGATDLRVLDLTFRVFLTLTSAGGTAGAITGATYEGANAMGMILRRLLEKSASFWSTILTNASKNRSTSSLVMRPSYSEVPINAKVSHDRVRIECSFCFPSFVVRFTTPLK